ncbi:hypothetical protein [Alteriqipengyuania sp.]|uniref:hypothetical protein n=1 Tax=Alteriqipengyuania sp. TaxID=2800692 RepID=UPI003516C67D
MKADMERRGFLVGIGALALVPGLASAAQGQARPVPEGAFRLERVLTRGLADGKSIVVTRHWGVAFEKTGPGALRITGKQTFAHVDAPASLQAISRIEARRDESDLFPLDLDAQGLIVVADRQGPVAPLPDSVLAEAISYAKARSAGENVTASSRQFLADLSQRGLDWMTGLPRDLFYPAPRDRRAEREIVLADGMAGTVAMREHVQADTASGLMTRYYREATTKTETMSRTGSETWSLAREVL